MKAKTIVLMTVAVCFGLVAAWATTQLARPTTTERVDVLVATREIPAGTLLRKPEDFFKAKPFIKGEEPKNAINSMELLKGKVMTKALSADQFCTLAHLGDKWGLEVAKGMRAIAVQVTSEKVAGGFVLPNSRVDVVLTTRETGMPKAERIMDNMRVLAVDTKQRPVEGQDSIAAPATVTLEASPDDALKLAASKERGKIELMLRSYDEPPSDTSPSLTKPVENKMEFTEVYVAATKLKKGDVLSDLDGQLKKKKYLREEVPANAINSPEFLKGQKLTKAVEPDQFFTNEDFTGIPDPDKLSIKPSLPKHVMFIVNGMHTDKVLFTQDGSRELNPDDQRNGSPEEDGKTTLPRTGSEGK